MIEILKMINRYGELKWEEGNASGEHNSNLSIRMFHESESIYDDIVKKLQEEEIWAKNTQ